jgi:hypothetical protein
MVCPSIDGHSTKDHHMFSDSSTSVDLVGRHRERLQGAAERRRLVFGGRRSSRSEQRAARLSGGPDGGTVMNVSLARIVAMPARVDRTSPRDARVA